MMANKLAEAILNFPDLTNPDTEAADPKNMVISIIRLFLIRIGTLYRPDMMGTYYCKWVEDGTKSVPGKGRYIGGNSVKNQKF